MIEADAARDMEEMKTEGLKLRGRSIRHPSFICRRRRQRIVVWRALLDAAGFLKVQKNWWERTR